MTKRYLPVASSKWSKWKKVRDAGYGHIQPNTRLYSEDALASFLNRYGTVFVKPDRGYGGTGVIRVSRRDGRHTVIVPNGKRVFANERKLASWLATRCKGKTYIVQQAIDLQPLAGAPVDIRTIVQKDEHGAWEVTAMFAKAAKKGKVVTNVKAGGRVLTVPGYLRQTLGSSAQQQAILKRLRQMSLRIARVFQAYYTNRVYALDIGMDRRRKLWLIEVNTHPSFAILKKIDLGMYKRAMKLRNRKRPS